MSVPDHRVAAGPRCYQHHTLVVLIIFMPDCPALCRSSGNWDQPSQRHDSSRPAPCQGRHDLPGSAGSARSWAGTAQGVTRALLLPARCYPAWPTPWRSSVPRRGRCPGPRTARAPGSQTVIPTRPRIAGHAWPSLPARPGMITFRPASRLADRAGFHPARRQLRPGTATL